MLTHLKNGIQKLKLLALTSLFPLVLLAQPVHLKAELDMLNGLQSNAVRVIKKDAAGRVWLGTYQGLQVLNNSNNFIDSLQVAFQNKPVWALEFYRNLVIIGARFDGLHIINLESNKTIVSFDSSQIGLVRKFRIIDDTLFIATRGNPYYLPLSTLKLHKIKASPKEGFATDFTKWKGEVLLSYYREPFGDLHKLRNDSMVQDLRYDFRTLPSNSLSITSDSSRLIVGGSGLTYYTDRKGVTKKEIVKNTLTDKRLPAWDVAIAGHRSYMVFGDPDNVQQGMIHEPSITSSKDLKDNFYGLSLMYDLKTKGLWAGTENAGLFYWPSVNSYTYFPSGMLDKNFKVFSDKSGYLFLFDQNKVLLSDVKHHNFSPVFQLDDQSIIDLDKWNDTLAILTSKRFVLVRNGKVIYNKNLVIALYNTVRKRDGNILLFSMYGDLVSTIDLNSNIEKPVNAPSNQIRTADFKNGIFYHSTYTGFVYYDTSFHIFTPRSPSNESYALSNDTLWTLNAGILSSYRITLDNDSLAKIKEFNFKTQLKSFAPKWLVSVNNKIYCGNNQGFVRVSNTRCSPYEYFYMGNYAEGTDPKVFNDTIFFQHTNYLAKLTPNDLALKIDPSNFSVTTNPTGNINENSPFIIEIKTNDYLIQKHSLKQVLLVSSGDSSLFYTIDDKYEITAGLKRGSYDLIIWVNGIEVSRSRIKVIIPLTSNPLFYLAVILFLAAFSALWVRYLLNKRKYEKQILDNRLQLLKQNLNPHFIFNSLNLIYSLVLQRKNEAAVRTINNFSDLHRYYLDNVNKGEITIAEEFAFIESYLKLESERREVDDPFIYHLPKPGKNDYLVPPMILQPLVENAVKYGGPDLSIGQESIIWIDMFMENGLATIAIENTVNEQTKKNVLGNGLGLKLVEERIDIYNKFYKGKITLITGLPCRHTGSGYRIEIRI